jgi:hypothetical protein
MARGVRLGRQTARKLIELARKRKGLKLPGMDDRFREAPPDIANTITVYNSTDTDCPEFGVLELDGTVLNAADLDLPADAASAVYTGVKPENIPSSSTGAQVPIWNKRIVIAQEAIPAGEIGQCLLNGVSPVKVYSQHNPNPYQAHASFASPLGRLDAAYFNTGFGFPILWREPGTGEKWAIVKLGHNDAPSYYRIYQPITGTWYPPITSNNQTSQGWSTSDSGMTIKTWRTGGNVGPIGQIMYNSAVPFADDATGLRIHGQTMWVGLFTGSLNIWRGLSSDQYLKPYLDLGNGYFPYRGGITINVVGDGVETNGQSWYPTWRAIDRYPYTSLGQFTPAAIVDVFNFNVHFVFRPTTHNVVSSVVNPIKIQISIGSWQINAHGVYTNPNYPWVQAVKMNTNWFYMQEVNPAHITYGAYSSGGTPGGGISVPAMVGPSVTQTKSGDPTSTAANPSKGAIVYVKPTQTLSAPYGGTGAAPIP